uniref:Uncharacterized protein n=1 Tax=Anguilla anguilla TaxID=7936 RepID=A0A0E9S0D6_ANGAN
MTFMDGQHLSKLSHRINHCSLYIYSIS